jgi:uncharacterized membrane protein
MLRWIIRTFLEGVITVLPLVITVAVVMWVADFINRFLGPGTILGGLLRKLGLPFSASYSVAYIVGWVIVLAVVFGVGILVEFGARRLIHERLDGIGSRLPMLGGIYGTVRQLVGMMGTKGNQDLKGMSVVFCTFGGANGAAFLALLPTREVFPIGSVDYHAVLVPSAPVPVGGSLIYVPVDAVHPADISVDAFMSIYVSMGVTGSQFLKAAAAKLAPGNPPITP